MDDVGLLVLGWELPYLRPCWLRPGGPWDGEEPPWIGLAGSGGPGGPANLAFWDHDQWLGGGCLWGWLASLSTLRQTRRGINILMPLLTNDYARRISSSGNCQSATCSYVHIGFMTLLVLKTTDFDSDLQLELSQCALSLLSCRQTSRGRLCSGACLVIGEWRPAGASFNYQRAWKK